MVNSYSDNHAETAKVSERMPTADFRTAELWQDAPGAIAKDKASSNRDLAGMGFPDVRLTEAQPEEMKNVPEAKGMDAAPRAVADAVETRPGMDVQTRQAADRASRHDTWQAYEHWDFAKPAVAEKAVPAKSETPAESQPGPDAFKPVSEVERQNNSSNVGEQPWTRRAREAREEEETVRRLFDRMDMDMDDRLSKDELKSFSEALEEKMKSTTNRDEYNRLLQDSLVLDRVRGKFDTIKKTSNDDNLWESGISRKDVTDRALNLSVTDRRLTDANQINNFVQKNMSLADQNGDGELTQGELGDFKKMLDKEAERGFLAWNYTEDDRIGVQKTIEQYGRMHSFFRNGITRQNTLDLLENEESAANR